MLERYWHPAPGARLSESPERLRLTFTEPVPAEFDPVEVTGPGGDARVAPEDDRVVEAGLEALPAGTCTVEYRVTSIDGHVISDSYEFAVMPPAEETTQRTEKRRRTVPRWSRPAPRSPTRRKPVEHRVPPAPAPSWVWWSSGSSSRPPSSSPPASSSPSPRRRHVPIAAGDAEIPRCARGFRHQSNDIAVRHRPVTYESSTGAKKRPREKPGALFDA